MRSRCVHDGFVLPRAPQLPAADEHERAPDKKTYIPVNPLVGRHGLVDMMNPQQMVVYQSFYKIENPEAHEQRTRQHLP